jgi:WD40 repeat protein
MVESMHRLRSLLSALKPTRLGFLFAVLIGLGVGFWQWSRPPRPRSVIENVGFHARGQFSPDSQTLAIVHGEPERGGFLTLWNIQTGERKDISIGDGWNAAFSPSGRTVARRSTSKIHTWDVATGKELAVYDDLDGERHSQLAFSPEGRLLAVRKNHVLWDVAANRIVKKLAQDGEKEQFYADKNILVMLGEGNLKIWDLATASLCAEIKIPREDNNRFFDVTLSLDHSLLAYDIVGKSGLFIENLLTGQSQRIEVKPTRGEMAISPDAQAIAVDYMEPQQNSWWSRFTQWLGIQGEPSGYYVTLKTFPAWKDIVVLKDCNTPSFSPDGKTLAVNGMLDGSFQLWDLPIRKPIGKILGLAGLASVATLLALGGLGWLRRRRGLLHARKNE